MPPVTLPNPGILNISSERTLGSGAEMKRYLTTLSLTVLLWSPLPAQKADKIGTFEVADVHASAPGTPLTGGFMPGGRIELRGVTLLELIADAYGLENSQVAGGPAWLNSDKFDVIAKAPAASTPEERLAAMLKNLLVERFKLVTHEEKRDSPVFVLTVAKGGPKMKKIAEEPSGPAGCKPGTGDPALNQHLACHNLNMDSLAEFLPDVAKNFVNHPVINETKLKGAYDFPLDWMGRGIYNAAKANPDGPPAVSIFDAVDKLGLKLEPGKRKMPVLVVDSANETPTPNAPDVTAKIPSYPTEFDVAEVRPAKTAPPPGTGPLGKPDFRNGQVEIMGATLKGLITFAFNVRAERISGAPKWMDEDRFDIIAKGPAAAPEEAIQGMLKNLLIERFQLETHSEEQPLQVYVLLAGKKSKLKESDGKERSDCSIEFISDRRTYVCRNTTMAQFAERLPSVSAAYIKPPLVDLTEITGAYDFEVYWTPKAVLPVAKPRPADGADPAEAATPANDVTVFEAVDKQLGLKLEEQKHPVPVLVIDRVLQIPVEK